MLNLCLCAAVLVGYCMYSSTGLGISCQGIWELSAGTIAFDGRWEPPPRHPPGAPGAEWTAATWPFQIYFQQLLFFSFLFLQTCLFGMHCAWNLRLTTSHIWCRVGKKRSRLAFISLRQRLGSDMIHLWMPRLTRASVLVNLFVLFSCVCGANCWRMETLAQMKSTQSLPTTAHWAAARWGRSSWVCCFGFGSPWCVFGVCFFLLVFSVQFSPFFHPLLCGLSGEWSGVRKHVIPWFPFKKPTLMLLNASSRQWAVQVSYKLTK